MRIVVHDYAGHPFQMQLSRELAARDHDVLHLYCSSYDSGHGAVSLRADDPESLAIEPVDSGVPFAKYAAAARFRHERRYGQVVAARVARWEPDAVLSANTPLLAQRALLNASHRASARFVFWQQDVISVAIDAVARRRIPVVGAAVGALASRLERSVLAGSDHVVVISEDFLPILQRWGLAGEDVSVIENWAPLEELAVAPGPGQRWAETHDLAGRTVLMYTGTLGLKHNPGLLLDLARSVGDRDDVRVVVISEGLGADWLRAENDLDPAPALVLLPYQPYEVLPEVMTSADVLVAILEPEAGVFSVPSKVLSYHCAGRPILAAIPAVNLAARIIARTGSGLVVEPSDGPGFVARAWDLLDQPAARREMGTRARRYAEETFDITAIGTRFEALLAGRSSVQTSSPSTSTITSSTTS